MKYYSFRHKKGDTFNGVSFEVKVNGAAVDLTDAVIEADFVTDTNTFTLGTADSSILITDATAGKFAIVEQVIDEAAGAYKYDIQITFPDTTVKTWIFGVLTIKDDVTS